VVHATYPFTQSSTFDMLGLYFAKGTHRLLKRLVFISIGLLLVVAFGVAALWIDMQRFAHRPAGPNAPRIVTVTSGEAFSTLATKLKKKGIISSVWRFKLIARVNGDDTRLKAGEYELAATMPPVQILDILVTGKVLLHRIVVPEGFTLAQVAAQIAHSGVADAAAFETLAKDPALITEFGLAGSNLEGYLFPDTYYFPRNVPARTLIETMVRRFEEQFPPQWKQRAEELGMTVHQVVTLASIIEKETGDPSERALIASVFHNRLKKKMRLQSDPTVIYGIAQFDGNITRRHLNTPTPFNTYQIGGLPPGPIANPGKASIEATLYPAQTRFLYFVSKTNGTHHFSTSLKEHNRAVRKYQLRRKTP